MEKTKASFIVSLKCEKEKLSALCGLEMLQEVLHSKHGNGVDLYVSLLLRLVSKDAACWIEILQIIRHGFCVNFTLCCSVYAFKRQHYLTLRGRVATDSAPRINRLPAAPGLTSVGQFRSGFASDRKPTPKPIRDQDSRLISPYITSVFQVCGLCVCVCECTRAWGICAFACMRVDPCVVHCTML